MKSPIIPPAPLRRAGHARPRRRRLGPLGLAGVAVAMGVLGGCQTTNTPTSYEGSDGVVRKNFMATCTGNIPNESTTTVVFTEAGCACAFDRFKELVPYNGEDRARVPGYPADKPTFQDIEGSLGADTRENEKKYNELPQDVRDKVQACRSAGQSGPVAPGSTAPSGTAPGTTTGTAPA